MNPVKVVTNAIIIILIVALASAIYAWYKESNKPPMSKVEYVKVPEIKEVTKIKKVNVPGPKEIVTIEKVKVVEKLKLPEGFRQDVNEQVIATGVIPAYEGQTNVVATLNTQTGVGGLIVKQEPLSFVGFTNDKELYGKVGYGTNRELEVSVGGRWLFARVGKVKIGAYAEGKTEFTVGDSNKAVAGLVITY